MCSSGYNWRESNETFVSLKVKLMKALNMFICQFNQLFGLRILRFANRTTHADGSCSGSYLLLFLYL